MARLKAEHKTFIVQRLACFDTPSTVAAAVKEAFSVDMTRQRVEQYDPTKAAGKALSQQLIDLFNSTRERFINDTTDIAVSHKAVRLRRLQRMADKAEKVGNIPLAAQLLEQAAKEAGDHYTNLRKIAPTTPDGKESYQGMTEQELDQRIAELQAKLGEGA